MTGNQSPGPLTLTFNEYPVSLPDTGGSIEGVIAARQNTEVMRPPPHQLASWERIDFEPDFPAAIDLSIANYPSIPPVGINQLYWPCVGAGRFAFGIFLMTAEDWASAKAANPSGLFNMQVTSGDATFSKVMFPMKPRPLTQTWNRFMGGVVSSAPDTLLIVPVVDERFLWQAQPLQIEKNEMTSWATLTTAIRPYLETHETLGIPAALTGLLVSGANDRFMKPDRKNLASWQSVAAVVDAMCATLGIRYYNDLIGHGFARSDAEVTLCETLANSERLLGGGLVEVRRPDTLVFRYHQNQTPAVYEHAITFTPDLVNSPEWEIGINSSLQTTDTNRAEQFFATVGTQWQNWYKCQFDVLLEGVQVFDTLGYVDALHLDLGSVNGNSYSLKTRAYSTDPLTMNLQNLVEYEEESSSSCAFEDLTLWICCNVGLDPDLLVGPTQMTFDTDHFKFTCCRPDPIEPTAELCQLVRVYEDRVEIEPEDGTPGDSDVVTIPYDGTQFCRDHCLELPEYNIRVGSRADSCNCLQCTFPSLDLWLCCGPDGPPQQMNYTEGGGADQGLDFFYAPCQFVDVEYTYDYQMRVYRDRIEFNNLGVNDVPNDWTVWCNPDVCVEVPISPDTMSFIPLPRIGNNEVVCDCNSESRCLFSDLELWLCCDITTLSTDSDRPRSYKMVYHTGIRPGDDYFESKCPDNEGETKEDRVIRVYRDRVEVKKGDREWILGGADFDWEEWCKPDFCYEFSFAGNPYFGIGNTPSICGCESECLFGDIDLWICCGTNQPVFQMQKRVEADITVYVADCGDFKITIYPDKIVKYYDEGPELEDNRFSWEAWCEYPEHCVEILGVFIGNTRDACADCASESISEPCEDLGIRWNEIPVVSAANAQYILGLDSNNCLVKIEIAACS